MFSKKDQSDTGQHKLSSVGNYKRHNVTGGPKLKIRIPRSCSIHNFVISDSNLRTIDRKRLDWTGKTHVRTMPGARVPDVTASLRACAVCDDLRWIILHVGGNDIHKQYSAEDLETDLKELVAEVTRVFPKAEVGITALLPYAQYNNIFVPQVFTHHVQHRHDVTKVPTRGLCPI